MFNLLLTSTFVAERVEKLMVSILAKVEHRLRAIKRQFGFNKACLRVLAKNKAQLVMLFALSNLLPAARVKARTGQRSPPVE